MMRYSLLDRRMVRWVVRVDSVQAAKNQITKIYALTHMASSHLVSLITGGHFGVVKVIEMKRFTQCGKDWLEG